MFKKAVRMKLRFTFRGSLSVEDLWDLSVESLDEMFQELNASIKSKQGDSLLESVSKADEVTELKISIIKFIVKTKLEEKKLIQEKAKRAAHKQKIMAIIAKKKDEELEGMDLADLEKELEDE